MSSSLSTFFVLTLSVLLMLLGVLALLLGVRVWPWTLWWWLALPLRLWLRRIGGDGGAVLLAAYVLYLLIVKRNLNRGMRCHLEIKIQVVPGHVNVLRQLQQQVKQAIDSTNTVNINDIERIHWNNIYIPSNLINHLLRGTKLFFLYILDILDGTKRLKPNHINLGALSDAE